MLLAAEGFDWANVQRLGDRIASQGIELSSASCAAAFAVAQLFPEYYSTPAMIMTRGFRRWEVLVVI